MSNNRLCNSSIATTPMLTLPHLCLSCPSASITLVRVILPMYHHVIEKPSWDFKPPRQNISSHFQFLPFFYFVLLLCLCLRVSSSLATEQYNGVAPPPPSYQGNQYLPPSGPPPGNEYNPHLDREQQQHDETMRQQALQQQQPSSTTTAQYAPPTGAPPQK